jgi:hypothetical protein
LLLSSPLPSSSPPASFRFAIGRPALRHDAVKSNYAQGGQGKEGASMQQHWRALRQRHAWPACLARLRALPPEKPSLATTAGVRAGMLGCSACMRAFGRHHASCQRAGRGEQGRPPATGLGEERRERGLQQCMPGGWVGAVKSRARQPLVYARFIIAGARCPWRSVGSRHRGSSTLIETVRRKKK